MTGMTVGWTDGPVFTDRLIDRILQRPGYAIGGSPALTVIAPPGAVAGSSPHPQSSSAATMENSAEKRAKGIIEKLPLTSCIHFR